MCLVGFSGDIAPHFRGEIPPNPQFRGVNRRFQAKRANYWKFYVIETTALILTKFATTIDTTKWSSWVVPVGAQQIPRWRTAAILKKSVKSPYLCDRSIDFDEIWHDDACPRPPSWKITKIAIFPQRFDRSLRNLVRWCKVCLLTSPTGKKFEFHKSKMAGGRQFENR